MKILIVEDDSTEREVLRHLLELRFQQEAKFRGAEDLKTAFAYLDRGDVDCIVLDLQLPVSDGKDTFSTLHTKYPAIPIIVMTHNQDRDLALDIIRKGAADYLIKSFTTDETMFRRIVFAVDRQKRGLQIPYDQLPAAMVERKDPEAITRRPQGLRTIHVPEVGPKPRSTLPTVRRPRKAPPDLGNDETPPVEIDAHPSGFEETVVAIASKLDAVLALLCLLLVVIVVALVYSRGALP